MLSESVFSEYTEFDSKLDNQLLFEWSFDFLQTFVT